MALGVLVLLAPPAAAFELTLEGPAAPIAPETPVPWSLVAEVPCTLLLEAVTAPRLQWHGESDEPGITIVVPDPTPLDPLGCGNGTATLMVEATAEMAADRTVPAGSPLTVSWTATLEGSGETAMAHADVVVAHTGGIDVHAPATIKKGAPQKQLTYPLELRNLANGPTTVRFEIGAAVEGDAVAPTPVVLAQAGQPGDLRTVEVLYSTPFQNGPNDAKETFTVWVHASSPDGTPLEEPHEVVLMAHTEGLYIPGPAAGPWLVAGLVLVAIHRRRS